MNWSVRRPPAQVLKLLDEVKAGRSVSPGSPSKKASLVASSVPGHVYTASTVGGEGVFGGQQSA